MEASVLLLTSLAEEPTSDAWAGRAGGQTAEAEASKPTASGTF